MLVNQVNNGIYGLQPQLPQRLCMIQPQHRLECVLIGALSCAHVPTIAPGCAPAHAVGLQQYHAVTALPEVQGTGQACVTAANNADVCVNVAAK